MVSIEPESNAEFSPSSATDSRSTRGFWALIATQFQGAYSDNILRNLLLSMIVGMGLARDERETPISLVTLLFSVPFIFFSMAGGWLADHFSKRQITIWTKVMEMGSMVVATIGSAAHSQRISLVALTLVATQAALFAPSKYGLLPELSTTKRLSRGNGVIELGTFLAIIVGTVTGAAMAEHFREREVLAGYALLALALAGLATSFGIDRVPAAAPEKRFRINFLGDLWEQISLMRRDQALFVAVIGNTFRAAALSAGVPRILTFLVPPIWRTEEILSCSSVPVQIVHGEDDRLIPPRMAQELKACGGPNCELVIVPKLSHDDPYRSPEKCYWDLIASHLMQPRGADD
jgi:MFS family permease